MVSTSRGRGGGWWSFTRRASSALGGDLDAGGRTLGGAVADRLHVVAVRVPEEAGVVAGMVGPLARGAVVAAAGGEAGLVEGVDGGVVLGLEGEVHVGRRPAL